MNEKKAIAALVVALCLLTSCSASNDSSSTSSSQDNYDYAESGSSYESDYYSGEVSEIIAQEQMVIKNASMTMETDEFEAVETEILTLAVDCGGYVQNSSSGVSERNGVEYSYGNYELRVPSDYFENVVEQVKGLGKVSYVNMSQEDVSNEYYDMDSRLQTRQAEAARLEQLIEDTSDITTKLALEVHLTDVREQIYILQLRMTNVERQVDYSTISISLTEVTSEQMLEDTFLTNVKAAFSGSLNFCRAVFEAVIVFVAGAVVPLAAIAVTVAVIALVYKKVKRRKR